ncbi:MAG: 50S ribosomal protein L11 methyltransferase [Paludibacteraceae bacterium]|nr:50S ribosomal protein L11 methyltransferase [Paludibacteraceae bacterium]
MRYHVLHIETTFAETWQADIFAQQISELGVDTIDGEDYYIQSEVWEQNADEIEAFCTSKEGVRLKSVEACPDENWNATWEAEHPMQELPLGIKIIPHCAFGAGHHETTSMMIDSLLAADLSNKNVLDHGTGTGVLAIFAKHLGAAEVVAVDIDEKSVENAKENAALNNEKIEVRLGDSVPEGQYDLILANIHRNVLLANMSAYAASLKEGGELWLSGFYETDVPILTEAAKKEGLSITQVLANGEWQLMKCHKEVHS